MTFFDGIISLPELEKLNDEDSAVVMCNTTDMPHVEKVTIKHCNLCGRPVWFADSTLIKIPPNVTVYLTCLGCYGPKLGKTQMQMPTDEQLQEIAKEAGVPYEIVKTRITKFIMSHNKLASFEGN